MPLESRGRRLEPGPLRMESSRFIGQRRRHCRPSANGGREFESRLRLRLTGVQRRMARSGERPAASGQCRFTRRRLRCVVCVCRAPCLVRRRRARRPRRPSNKRTSPSTSHGDRWSNRPIGPYRSRRCRRQCSGRSAAPSCSDFG